MRHLLPTNLAKLANLVDPDAFRYPLAGVRVELTDTTYAAIATDSRLLAYVEGDLIDEEKAFVPKSPLPNGATESIVPWKDWKQVFSSAPKRDTVKTPAVEVSPAADGSVALAVASRSNESVRITQGLEGRFPKWRDIKPTGNPRAIVALKVKLLEKLLAVAADMTDEDGGVVMEIYGHDDAIWLRGNRDGQRFTAALMPMASDEVEKISKAIDADAAVEHVTHETAQKPPKRKRPALSRRK